DAHAVPGSSDRPLPSRGLPALGGAAAAVTATAAAATTTLLSLVDAERATAQVLAIEVLDGARGIRAGHFHEAEAARTTRVPIGDQAHGLHGAVLREQLTHLGIGRGKRQVANIDLRHAINS